MGPAAGQLDTPFATASKDVAPGAQHEPPKKNSSRSGMESWGIVKDSLLSEVSVSQAFTTLRDMVGNTLIPPSSLQTVEVLGQGAFAMVEKAWYTPPDGGGRSIVAVKRLKKDLFRNSEDLRLFLQEVELMKKLRHRNIVGFVGAGEITESSDCAYIVQEYMGGGSLKQLVTRQMLGNGKLVYSDTEALDICLQMARGLRYLHQANPMVIHRDLKLENVLLKSAKPASGDDQVKLCDFGLSRRVEAKHQAIAMRRRASSANLKVGAAQSAHELERLWDTRANSSFLGAQGAPGPMASYALTGRTGSLMYMAPEVFNEEPYSEKCDVFSFGIMMHEVVHKYVMLSAVAIAGTYEELEQYASRVAGGYRPPIHKNLPDGVRSLIEDCWAQEPAARPSMNSVVTRLEAIKASGEMANAGGAGGGGCCCTIC